MVAGCWLLVAGYWLLVAGCWLLVAGCWLLVAGCWLLVQAPPKSSTSSVRLSRTPSQGEGNRYLLFWGGLEGLDIFEVRVQRTYFLFSIFYFLFSIFYFLFSISYFPFSISYFLLSFNPK